jgi:hypothetical protein
LYNNLNKARRATTVFIAKRLAVFSRVEKSENQFGGISWNNSQIGRFEKFLLHKNSQKNNARLHVAACVRRAFRIGEEKENHCVAMIEKEELDAVVVELTRSFGIPTESKDIANVQRIRADYDQYFQKSQAEIKQLIRDCTLRVKKAEAATKLPNDNHEATSSTLKKHIASTLKSTAATEDRIEELKQMNEQVPIT